MLNKTLKIAVTCLTLCHFALKASEQSEWNPIYPLYTGKIDFSKDLKPRSGYDTNIYAEIKKKRESGEIAVPGSPVIPSIPPITEFELAFLKKLAEITKTDADRELLESCYPNGEINEANLPILRETVAQLELTVPEYEAQKRLYKWLVPYWIAHSDVTRENVNEKAKQLIQKNPHARPEQVFYPSRFEIVNPPDFTMTNFDWEALITNVCDSLASTGDGSQDAYIHLKVKNELQQFQHYVQTNFSDYTFEELFPDPSFRLAILKGAGELYEPAEGEAILRMDICKSSRQEPPRLKQLTVGICYLTRHLDFRPLDKILQKLNKATPQGRCDLTGITKLPNLRCLILAHFDSYQVPELTVGDLPHLEEIRQTLSKMLISGFGKVPSLKILEIERMTQTQQNTEALCEYRHIESLSIDWDDTLSKLPKNLQMHKLRSLTLVNTIVAEPNAFLMDTLARFPALEELNMTVPAYEFEIARLEQGLNIPPRKRSQLNAALLKALPQIVPNAQIKTHAPMQNDTDLKLDLNKTYPNLKKLVIY